MVVDTAGHKLAARTSVNVNKNRLEGVMNR